MNNINDKFEFSVLPEELHGVCLFYTGQAGAGKTTASLLDPFNTVVIDADHFKSERLCAKNGIEYYSVNSTDKNNPALTGKLFFDAVDSIDVTKTTVVVMDNLYEIQEGLHAYAIQNPVDVAKRTNKVASKITGRQWGQDTLAHERLLKGVVDELLANKVTVVIIAHMKEKFGVIGQLEIRGRNWVYEAASFVGIMIRTGAAPDVLVFKSGFLHHVPVDPRKLKPEELEQYRSGQLESCKVYPQLPRRIPDFTPSKMFQYLARTPEQIASTVYSTAELFDEEEMAPYMEILTKEQRANVDKMLEMDDLERQRAIAFEANMKEVQRVEMDQFIIDNQDIAMPELLNTIKTKFQMFANEIDPPYVLTVRNR